MSPILSVGWALWGTVFKRFSPDRDRLGSAGICGACCPICCPSDVKPRASREGRSCARREKYSAADLEGLASTNLWPLSHLPEQSLNPTVLPQRLPSRRSAA